MPICNSLVGLYVVERLQRILLLCLSQIYQVQYDSHIQITTQLVETNYIHMSLRQENKSSF